jgi:hypothetical protein
VQGEQKIANQVSGHYLAGHLGRTYDGMMITVPEEQWGIFLSMSEETFNRTLLQLADKVNLARFKKHNKRTKKATIKTNPRFEPATRLNRKDPKGIKNPP